MTKYTYAIGDAHGRLDLVEKAIQIAEEHLETSSGKSGTFVCCGDFVDRGPDSKGIIDLFMAGPSKPQWDWKILAGNHEDMMAIAARSARHLNWWLGNGGGRTLMSYGLTPAADWDDCLTAVPDEHINWLRSLPINYIDEHRAFVHAGFDPSKTLEEQDRKHMTWRYDGPKREDQADYTFLGKHVVHGHVQHQDGPLLLKNTSNIDTFAWAYGKLAIAVFDDSKPGGPIRILWAEGPAGIINI